MSRSEIDVLKDELRVGVAHNTANRLVHGGHGRVEITSNALCDLREEIEETEGGPELLQETLESMWPD